MAAGEKLHVFFVAPSSGHPGRLCSALSFSLDRLAFLIHD